MNYLKKDSKFNNLPVVEVKNTEYKIETGWNAICKRLKKEIASLPGKKKIVVVETYQGVIHEELIANLQSGLNSTRFIKSFLRRPIRSARRSPALSMGS